MIDPVALHPQVWAALQGRRAQLPHALLLSGQRGLGKSDLAREFVAGLLCEQPRGDGRPCGACLACGWQAQGNHPDFRLLQPEASAEADDGEEGKEGKKKASQQITIEQVRALDDFLTVGTHRAGLRIVLVNPAEAMNRATANSLLKSLEEPAPGTLFLLVSNEPVRLLATIRSRCQVVAVPLPPSERAVAILIDAGIREPGSWLALASGSPMLALALAQAGDGGWFAALREQLLQGGEVDALAGAAAIERGIKEGKGKPALRAVVEWAIKWMVDLTLVRNGLPTRYFVGQTATMKTLVAGVPEIRLLRFYRHLLQCRREAEQPLNARLFLEEFFLNYRALFMN